MFWGLTIEPGKHYTQTVEESFHVSMAALETRDHVAESSSEKTGVVQVIIKHEKTEFLVCSLFYGTVFQQRVDLNFTEGEEVTFCTEGRGTVHLTGYLVKEEYLDTDHDMMSLEDASSSEEVSVGSSEDDDDADISLQQLAQADMEDDDSEEDDWSPSAARGGGYPPGKRVKRKKLKKGTEEEGSPEKDSPSKRKRDGSGDADFAMMYQPPMRKSAKKARKTMAIAMAAKQDAAEESNEEGEDGKPEKINKGLMEGIIVADHDEDVPGKEQSKKTTAEIKAIVIADDDDDVDNVPGKKQSKKASVENKEIIIADDDEEEEEDEEEDEDYVPAKKTKVKSKGKSPGKEDTQKRKGAQDDLEEESETDDSEDGDYEEEDSEDEDFDSEDEEDDSEDEEGEEEDDDVKEVVPNGKAPKGKEGKKGKKEKNAAKADRLEIHSSPEKEPAKKEQQKKKKPEKKGGDNKENVSSGNGKEKEANQGKETPKKVEQKKKLMKATLKGGIQVQDKVEGQGNVAQPGKMVHVYYKGRFQSNNKQFDACMSGQPFGFRLGKGEVIKGWDVGVAGMKVGGKRQIIVPPSQGYGNSKQGPIPANSTLIFEIELRKVK